MVIDYPKIKCSSCGFEKIASAFYVKDKFGDPVCKSCSNDRDGRSKVKLERFVCTHCKVIFNRVVGEEQIECPVCERWNKSVRGVIGK